LHNDEDHQADAKTIFHLENIDVGFGPTFSSVAIRVANDDLLLRKTSTQGRHRKFLFFEATIVGY
jgi:hypothetical protein